MGKYLFEHTERKPEIFFTKKKKSKFVDNYIY